MNYKLPTRKLVSHSEHAMTQRPDVPRSRFVSSWTRKQTMNAGLVVPFMWDEVLPGDHLKYDSTAYLRMSTPIFPLFSNVKCDVFFFFVPNRLTWSNWERFMGEQATPTESIDVAHPFIQFTGPQATASLMDYLGLPVQNIVAGQSIEVNGIPFRAYGLIWNEWFRDQNLQDAVVVPTGDGNPSGLGYGVLPRGKFHDYFTSSLPWTQKFTAPTVPVGGLARVVGIGDVGATAAITGPVTARETGAPGTTPNPWPTANYANYKNGSTAGVTINYAFNGATWAPQVFADLTTATGVSINVLRQAVQIQRLLERDARGGTRYAEMVLAHFGVRPPDYRVQRPEYVGGGSSVIHVTPVAQTVPVTSPASPVGTLGAAATGTVSSRASFASTEHGVILGLISIRPEQAYQQGIPRKFSRFTRYDYYFPSLSQLGEQAVLRREIFATGVDADDTLTFGFQERYAEYRQYYSEVAGRFRSGVSGTLDAWHLAENFSSAPVLSPAWVEADDLAFDRVLSAGSTARTNNVQFLADILIQRDATRPLPMFGTPVGMGRF